MKHLALSFFCFLLGVIFHCFAYRAKWVRLEFPPLFGIFSVCFLLYLSSLFFFQTWYEGDILLGTSVALYPLYCLGYVAEMVVVRFGSPSMKIMELSKERPDRLATLEAIEKIFSDENILLPRLEDLVQEGFLRREDRHFGITPKGRCVAAIMTLYRIKLLGRPMGG